MNRGKGILLVFLVFIGSTGLWAQGRKTGMVFRGSFWPGNGELVAVSTGDGERSVDVGRGGSWLVVYSRLSERNFLEFSVGGIGDVKTSSRVFREDEVNVQLMTPFTLGLHHHLIDLENSLAIQPYVGVGGGPYWLSDVHVWDDRRDAEVSIGSKLVPGVYGCAGFDFMMASWVGFNMDFKYHMVNMDPGHRNSGFEMGFGLLFRWGSFEPGS